MKEMLDSIAVMLEAVKQRKPLVHHLTNYVTVNDCANITLAIGASPVMADEEEDAAAIASVASAVVLNIGTLNKRTIQSMLTAGKVANQCGVPVILDPVGVGASELRNKTAARIIDEIKLAVIRGNMSEIKALSGVQSSISGVDAGDQDVVSEDNIGQGKDIVFSLARNLQTVVAATGAVDVVSDGRRVYCVKNGHSMLAGVSGTGCMSASLTGAFCGAADGNWLTAASAALVCMGLAGEISYAHLPEFGGSSTFRTGIIDAISLMDANLIRERGKIYVG